MQLASSSTGSSRTSRIQHQHAPAQAGRLRCISIPSGLPPALGTCMLQFSRGQLSTQATALADPSSAHHDEEPTKAAFPGPKERTSVLQELLDKSSKQQGSTVQQATPTSSSKRWHASQQRTVTISNRAEAGGQAGALTAMLRARSHADVTFYGIMGIFKTLRVLALTNLFLGSHQGACSFTFAPVSTEEHQARLAQLMQVQRHSMSASSRDGLQHSSMQHRNTSAQHIQAAGQSQAGYSEQQAVPGQMPEPVPPQPLLFCLNVWARPAEHPEVQVPSKQVHILDFALDLRMEWRRCAYVSFDTALSIADNMYSQLMYECAQSSLSTADVQLQGQQQASGSQQPPLAAVVTGAPVQGSQAGTKQKRRKHEKSWPTVVFGADMNQSQVVFMALSFVEQRLQQEQHTHQLVCTVLRQSALPQARLDGRNGYLFKLELQPKQRVKQIMSRHKLPQRQSKRAASSAQAESTSDSKAV